MKKLAFTLYVLGHFFYNGNAFSNDISLQPFYVSNRNPLVQLYGVPEARSAQLPEVGDFRWGVNTDLASSFTIDAKADESIILDGETLRLSAQFEYGLSEQYSIALNIPYISHSSGFLDGFINDWHRFFGLSDGGRSIFEKNVLSYRYARNGQVLVDKTNDSNGLADVSVRLNRRVDSFAHPVAVQLGIKFPSGDAENLHGSGALDIYTRLLLSIFEGRWFFHGSAGLIYLGDGDVLSRQQERLASFGHLTVGRALTENIALKLQLDGHTALYKSDLTELSESVQLVIGGEISFANNWLLDIGVIEDVIVDASPDVVFHLALRRAL